MGAENFTDRHDKNRPSGLTRTFIADKLRPVCSRPLEQFLCQSLATQHGLWYNLPA
jgi:hypothetical protein